MTRLTERSFTFLDPGRLTDRELELVEPHPCWVEDMLAACHHPMTQRDMPAQARTTREGLLHFLRYHPRGRYQKDSTPGVVPAYTFWMRLREEYRPPVPMAGALSLRIGDGDAIELYFGHIGYHVYPPARGQHYAERACRLVLPLARSHGINPVWITTNPDNMPSRRTCERLGGVLTDIVPVPRDNPLYQQGDREKCRYRIDL